MSFQHIEDAARAACAQVGVDYRAVPHDGRFHTADITDDPRGKNDGRIQITQDGQRVQVFNNKSGERARLFLNSNKSWTMSAADKARIAKEQQRRDAKRRRMQDMKAAEAVAEYERAQRWPFTLPAYMVRKELSVPVGARLGRFDRSAKCVDGQVRRIVVDDVLLIPIRNRAGHIRNIQYIFPEVVADLGRDKTFIAGAELAGCFSCIGKYSTPMFLAEGWATAVSLFEDTGCRVFICFSATNLLAVGKTVRELHQDAELIFCADNDEKTAGNPGVTKATEAATAIDATVYIPPISGDYNDFKIQQRRLERERG